MMTIGSLFSGIGGLELGLERAGLGPVIWQAECDPYALKVLEKHWPHVKRYTDVKDIDETAEKPDLICGGFPCQPFSVAGEKKGEDDNRNMWPETIRVIRLLRPRTAVLENVSALLTYEYMGQILGDLAEVFPHIQGHCIPASRLGAHFRGDRIFIIASSSAPCIGGREGKWENKERPFSRDQFERLVQREIRLCVPAGKGSRVSDGLPKRVDRLRCLGNAVVPQVAEVIGHLIRERMPL